MKTYLVMNIGCIECGVSSAVVGIFHEKARAQEVADAGNEYYSWREGGQNSFEVFEMPKRESIADEYALIK